jgi:quercetin dioxygenase-like cupin family protein
MTLAMAPTLGFAQPDARRTTAYSMPQTARISRISLTGISGAPHHQLLIQSVSFEPGAAVPPHYHPGDKTVRIDEGEITFVIGDDPPRVFHAGDTVRIPAGVINAAYNLTDEPARALEIIVAARGEPLSTRIGARPAPYVAPVPYGPAPYASPQPPRRPGNYHPARDADEGNFVREDER